MGKVRVRIVRLGHIPHSIDLNKIARWESDLFEILPHISTFSIIEDSDREDWEFSDENIERQLPELDDADILLAVTNIPLESNYYARRLSSNRVCITYHNLTEILEANDVPLENLLLRMLYALSFVFKRYGNRVPPMNENVMFTHDETRGCIYDMNGILSDVVYSLDGPHLCDSCVETLRTTRENRIEAELIDKVQSELKDIRKRLYYRISAFVKRSPLLALAISSFVAVILGVLGSITASVIWERLRE